MQHRLNGDIGHSATRVGPISMGNTTVNAALFPGLIEGVPVNWSLAGIEQDAPGVERLSRLRQVSEALDLRTMWSPSPTEFNGRICERSELRTRVAVDAKRDAFVMRGTKADGCLIAPGESLIMSVGGCAVVIMEYEGRVAAMHAGLKCLYDHALATKGAKAPGRECESVVEAAGRALTTGGMALNTSRLHVRVLFPLSPQVHTHKLTDKDHGENNKKLQPHFHKQWGLWSGVRLEPDHTTLSFDTLAIVQAQCEKYFGLNRAAVTQEGPFADKIPYAHHTRSGPSLKHNRNLVVIKNLG